MSVRKWRRGWGGLAMTTALAAAFAGFAVVALEHWDADPPDPAIGSIPTARPMEPPDAPVPAPPALASVAAATVPAATLQATPEASGKMQDSLSTVPEPTAVFEDVELEAPYLILDGHSFTAGRWAITLKDIEAPQRDAVCLDKGDLLFACGLQARAALNNLLRGGKATCTVRLPPIYGRFESTCQVADGNLAELMVAQGWARPMPTTDGRFAAAMATAQKAELGLWNGGWRIRGAR